MKRKQGRVGKGNHGPALLLCSHRLRMLQENRPSLPALGYATPCPSPSPALAGVAGGDRDLSAPLLVSPSDTSLQPGTLQRALVFAAVQNAAARRTGRQSRQVAVSVRGCCTPGSEGLAALGSEHPLRASPPTRRRAPWDTGPWPGCTGVSHGAARAPPAATLGFLEVGRGSFCAGG